VSVANDSESGSGTPPEGPGVLSNLPRTRPQRSSPRRVAAREASAAATATAQRPARSGRAAATPAKPPKSGNGSRPQSASAAGGKGAPKSSARTSKGTPKGASKGARATTTARRQSGAGAHERRRFLDQEPVPRQGFECEGERASGPVQPPGGAELLASATEIVSEVAKAGLSTGERLLRDVLSRLPIS
jgi:hypothetical protein